VLRILIFRCELHIPGGGARPLGPLRLDIRDQLWLLQITDFSPMGYSETFFL
jgi:hypothetical protein